MGRRANDGLGGGSVALSGGENVAVFAVRVIAVLTIRRAGLLRLFALQSPEQFGDRTVELW